ncbi:MAG TPA: NADP-dependent phosphogluconate dehydrogenase [Ramlibacter sp.]|nr:NADP-dependent phosphogluconate dehydrogenase [Ramlibacter sp.]
MQPAPLFDIAVVGLGVMGQNLALNLARHGFAVGGYDLDEHRRAQLATRSGDARAQPARSLQELVAQLKAPRRVLVMVPAGGAVDAVIGELRFLLKAGDVIVDGGNTLFTDTQRRMLQLHDTGILLVGLGVSGGEEGALHGPSLMPGGDAQAWPLVQPMLQAIAARADDGAPCCEWLGAGGSGHFVKMVHNGIEYADMQTICEAYGLMQQVLGMPAAEIGATFAQWNEGELASYLVAITADILSRVDKASGRPLVDMILDTAEQKGTGKWASQVALDLGVTAPTIAEAVFARTISAVKEERVAASAVLQGPRPQFTGDRAQAIEKIRCALLAAKVCAYAQGFQLLRAADREHQWSLPFASIAGLWRAGCIIRARLLEDIRAAYARDGQLANLLVDPMVARTMAGCQQALREVVALAALQGVPAPSFMSALAYYDAYRSPRLPANLLQAQRDYFGAHTYQRIDQAGKFHTVWTH